MFGSCWNVTKCTGRPHTHGSSACRVATGVLFTTSDEARIKVLKGALRLTHQRHVENTPRSNLARAVKVRIKRPLKKFHKTQMHTGHGRAIHQQTRLSIRRTSSDGQTESRTRAIVLQYISHVAMCHALQILAKIQSTRFDVVLSGVLLLTTQVCHFVLPRLGTLDPVLVRTPTLCSPLMFP